MTSDGMRAAAEKMRAAGAHEEAIAAFENALRRLVSGHAAMLPSADLEPAGAVPALGDLPGADPRDALKNVVLIKLNGGLATSMGLQQPKSLVEAREGRSFLDIIVGQTVALRRRCDLRLPLVLMNSEATRAATEEALAMHPEIQHEGIALDFMQSMIPKLDAETLAPVSWPAAPALEWAPPGHGDVYGALRRSGMLEALLDQGFRYAMISNSDNLGAQLDPRIAAYIAAERVPFLMEVVQGTEADRKGGHIARRRVDGQLVLRETAQTPPEDEDSFRDYRHWRYYNTNNLWVDLRALAELLERSDGVLELPLIVNRKTVDPRDSRSTPVIQLESAMGAAIESFAGARILPVPRTRFVPVKTTDDLLVLRSDVYTLGEDFAIAPLPQRASNLPYVELDSRYYKLLDQFERRFSDGPPSLLDAERLVVHGDVTFGARVVVRGSVELDEPVPRRIEPGAVLESRPVKSEESDGADDLPRGLVTIVLADDHEVVRAGLRMLLDAEEDFEVVSEAGDVQVAERRVVAYRPKVLVLDVNMPGGSSIPAIPRIRESVPETHIVMLTMQNDPELAREALRAGATGYVLKESAESELIQAVRLAAEGRTYLNPELGARLAAEGPVSAGPPDDLSAREVEVLRLIALGHTNGEVASQLFLSVRTVESHRAHIQQKTGCNSRAQLVAYARDHGLA